MGIEIREGARYTFRMEKWTGLAPVTISAASLRIYSPGGMLYMGPSAMVISANVATLDVDFGASPTPGPWTRARNYRAEMTIDGVVHNRFFDLVLCPFVNAVTDADLANEWGGIGGMAETKRGEAESGDVDYLIDADRGEIADYWKGGSLTVHPKEGTEGTPTEHVVTSSPSGGRLNFTPARTIAIEAGQTYRVRRNFSAEIRIAGEIVAADLWKKERRIGLILDSTQVSRLIIYKVFERLFAGLQRGDKEEWKPLFDTYENRYAQELGSIELVYDGDDVGVPEDSASIGQILMDR